jgi:hypothetical protein
MHPLVKALVVASVLGLGACVAPTYGTRPQVVESQTDTFRFRIFPYAFAVGGIMADRAADDEIVKFRVANGYASSEILSRDSQDTVFVYTVKFTR